MNQVTALLSDGFALLALVSNGADAASVRVDDGNVVYIDDAGIAKTLTATRLDSAPSLSPDNKLVAFIRRTPGQVIPVGAGDEEAGELWTIATDGLDERLVVSGHRSSDPKSVLSGLTSPVFSPDGRVNTVYH